MTLKNILTDSQNSNLQAAIQAALNNPQPEQQAQQAQEQAQPEKQAQQAQEQAQPEKQEQAQPEKQEQAQPEKQEQAQPTPPPAENELLSVGGLEISMGSFLYGDHEIDPAKRDVFEGKAILNGIATATARAAASCLLEIHLTLFGEMAVAQDQCPSIDDYFDDRGNVKPEVSVESETAKLRLSKKYATFMFLIDVKEKLEEVFRTTDHAVKSQLQTDESAGLEYRTIWVNRGNRSVGIPTTDFNTAVKEHYDGKNAVRDLRQRYEELQKAPQQPKESVLKRRKSGF